MNKLYTLLLALLLAFSASAQTEFSTLQVPLTNPSRILTAVNDSAEVGMLAFQDGVLYSSVLDAQGQRKAESLLRHNHNERNGALGMIALPAHFIYFENIPGNSDAIRPYRIDRSTGNITLMEPLTPTLEKDSKLVQTYTYKNRLYTLYFSKKTNRLQVCELRSETEIVVKSFDTAVLKLYDRLLKGDANWQPIFIDNAQEQTLASSSKQKKIYQEGDNIYLVFDAFGAQRMNIRNLTTEVLQLNLATQKADFRTLPMVNKIRPIGMNSYVHQSILYRFLQMPDYSLRLAAYDLETMALKKEYMFRRQDPLTIKATPVFSASKADTAIVEQTEAVIKKLSIGTSTIIVEEASPAVLRITLGNYTLTNGNAAYLPTGASLLPFFGPAALPVMVALTAAKVQAKNTGESANSFSVYLKKEDLEQAAPIKQKSYFEQISAYDQSLSERKVRVAMPFAYTYQNQMHYGYVIKGSNTVHILSFNK